MSSRGANRPLEKRDRPERLFWVPKRRVPVRVRLADQSILDGEFYVSLQDSNESHAQVADRLIDPWERYVPLATATKHTLLNTSAIVTVQLAREPAAGRTTEGARELHVQLVLTSGTILTGRIHSLLPPANSRTLDYLNRMTKKFVPLIGGNKVTLVNDDYIVGVTEVIDQEPDD